ncbi:transposase [Prevotella sp. P5-126]|nr:transposase [Prevotella sp. P5-126]
MEYQYSLYDMDNLAAERAIRPFTVHRKNAVSFGSNTNYETLVPWAIKLA